MRKAVYILLFLFTQIGVFAQITIDNTGTADWYVKNVLLGAGVQASNITYSGSPLQIASFDNGASTNLGINKGVILSTGHASRLPDGSYSQASEAINTSPTNDIDLDKLGVLSTYDACILEFDFIPQGNLLEFEYVFGSEEYPEFVGSSYNDVFGFFVSGPGINGTFSNNAQNIALIPNTNNYVSINNVNYNTNPMYYVDNTSGNYVVYDAFTTVLTANVVVQAGKKYHIKMIISDIGDTSYDSGVCIKGGSFSSASDLGIKYTPEQDLDALVYGCTEASITYTLGETAYKDTIINYTIGGTAINGVDYEQLQNSFTVPKGSKSYKLYINPKEQLLHNSPVFLDLEFKKTDTTFVNYSIPILTNQKFTLPLDSINCTDSKHAFKVNGLNKYLWYASATSINPIGESFASNATDSIPVSQITDFTESGLDKTYRLWIEELEEVPLRFVRTDTLFSNSTKTFYPAESLSSIFSFNTKFETIFKGFSFICKNNGASDSLQINIVTTNGAIIASKKVFVPFVGVDVEQHIQYVDSIVLPVGGPYSLRFGISNIEIAYLTSSNQIDENLHEPSGTFGEKNVMLFHPYSTIIGPIGVKHVFPIPYSYNIQATTLYNKGGACGRKMYEVKEYCTTCFAPANVAINADTTFCNTSTLELKASYNLQNTKYAYLYQWYKNNILVESSETYKDLTIDKTHGSGIYKFRVVVNESKFPNCYSEDSIDITMYTTPIPTVPVPDTSYCQFEIPLALYAEGVNIRWYNTNTSTTPLFLKPTVKTDTVGTFTWYVSQNQNGCESPRKEVTVTVKLKPTVLFTNNLEYCQFDTVTQFSVTSKGTLQWYNAVQTKLVSKPIVISTQVGVQAYYVSQVVNGCESDLSAISATIKEIPSAPIVDSLKTACQYDTISNISVIAEGTLQWYKDVLPFPKKMGEIPLISTQTPDTSVYFVTQTVNECKSKPSYITVIVKEAPVITVHSTDANNIICENENVFIFTKAQGAYTYEWINSKSIALGTMPSIAVKVPEPTTYYVRATAPNGCSVTDSLHIDISPYPNISIIGDSLFCEGASENYFVLTTSDNTIVPKWSNTGESMLFTKDNIAKRSVYLDVYDQGIDTLILEVVNSENCYSKTSKVLRIAEPPQVDFISQYNDENIILENLSTQNQEFFSNKLLVSYIWDIQERNSHTYIEQTDAEYYDKVSVPHKYVNNYVTLTAQNEFGCATRYTKEIIIDIKTNLYFPNAFAPSNPSAEVRTFHPIGMNLATCKVWVFDTWGNLVWYGDEVKDGIFISQWDGTSKGEMLKADTYIWHAEASFKNDLEWVGVQKKNKVCKKYGSVLLIR